MMPGPTTASSAARRTRQDLKAATRTSVLPPQQIDHIVCRDDSGKAPLFVNDGKREQVVFVEECDHLVFGRVEVTIHRRSGDEPAERRVRISDHCPCDRNGADQLSFWPGDVDGRQGLEFSL